MAGLINRGNRNSPAVSLWWCAYLGVSILLLIVLSLDSYINEPSGWIKLELFTSKPVRHGFDPCSWDYEGSWKIGTFSGQSLTSLNISTTPVIACADVTSTSASFVKSPFVHIPGDDERLDTSKWTVFYELRNLQTYKSEIGISESRDGGATWQHVGIALADRKLSFSSPFIVYDAPSQFYVMLPDAWPSAPQAHGSRSGGLRAFYTTTDEFPLGWRPLSVAITAGGKTGAATAPSRRLGSIPVPETQGSVDGAASEVISNIPPSLADGGVIPLDEGSWGPSDHHSVLLSSITAVKADGRWWVFAMQVQPPILPFLSPRSTPVMYTAEGSLLSRWKLHPASENSPILRSWGEGGSSVHLGRDSAARLLSVQLPAGRPFQWEGSIHRWVHTCRGSQCGFELTLLRAMVHNATHFQEEVVTTYLPEGDYSWHAQRLSHADVWPLPPDRSENGSNRQRWWGLISADRYTDGMHHFLVHELWFVQLKASLRNLIALQLALVVGAVLLQAVVTSSERERPGSIGSKSRHEDDTGGWRGVDGSLRLWGGLQGVSRSPMGLAVLGAADVTSRVLHGALLRTAASWDEAIGSCRRLAGQPRVQLLMHAVCACMTGLVVAVVVMVGCPSAVPCSRWTVVVQPLEPRHYVPSQPFRDPGAPFNVSSPPLVIVTGCTLSFMDRLENLVGSLQYWAPGVPIIVYDLGFTSEQLAQMRCWPGVELVRFPYEDYPPHVREINNYAFKPLLLQHALQRHPTFIWMDCGLEVRGPLDSLTAVLSRDGYVSAQQSDSPADYLYTEKYALPYFNISDQDYQRIKNLPFCASGLQGYVRGAASERLILGPAVTCALHVNCTGAPGHSRAVSMYEQTALTLHIRLNNYSSCMPRHTHCTSSVKKLAWDPTASSAPIIVASRRHRWPKPYRTRLSTTTPIGCKADPASNPWRTISSEHQETVAKSSSLLFKVGFVYGQAAGDYIIQAGCCLGFHVLAQSVLMVALLAGEARRRMVISGALPSGVAPGCGWWWLCRPQPLLAGLLLMVGLMALSLVTACRA